MLAVPGKSELPPTEKTKAELRHDGLLVFHETKTQGGLGAGAPSPGGNEHDYFHTSQRPATKTAGATQTSTLHND